MAKKGIRNLIIAAVVLVLVISVSGFFFIQQTALSGKVKDRTIEETQVIDNVKFAGFDWEITASGINSFGVSNSFNDEGFLILKAAANSAKACNTCSINGASATICAETDVKDIDELIVIVSPSGYAKGTRSAGSGISWSMLGAGNSCSTFFTCVLFDDPKAIKLINNFDGTWDSFISLGIGDIFIRDKTVDNPDDKLKLCVSGASGEEGGSISGSLTLYNIITKEDEAAICKADEVVNVLGECEKLDSILLAHEQSLFEGFDDQIARIEERFQQKIDGLEAEIINSDDSARIAELEAELAQTKLIATELEKNVGLIPVQIDIEDIISKIKEGETVEEAVQNYIPEQNIKEFNERKISTTSLMLIGIGAIAIIILIIVAISIIRRKRKRK